jgi:OOP family OmpA-OmpF porin
MTTRSGIALAALAVVVAAAGTARAQAQAQADRGAQGRIELGGFLGPHIYSEDSALGFVEGVDTSLRSTVALGPRLGWQALRWVALEAELQLAVTSTREFDVDVFTVDLRGHARVDLPLRLPVLPFVLVGVGAPTSLSEKRGFFGSDVQWEVYGGAGARFEPRRGINLRLDVRVLMLPARGDQAVTSELEGFLSAYVPIGGGDHAERARRRDPEAEVADRDGDGLLDPVDSCPTRAEDGDGYKDDDGCPDIDNDMDHVLDIADKCPAEPELPNGYMDDDGCNDEVPEDIAKLVGPIDDVRFNSTSVELRTDSRKSLARIARVMLAHPSVRFEVLGYTDDREVEAVDGEEPEAQEAREAELGEARAKAVIAYLITQGIGEWRLLPTGRGRADPVDSNDSTRGRLHNRRVELAIKVPPPL